MSENSPTPITLQEQIGFALWLAVHPLGALPFCELKFRDFCAAIAESLQRLEESHDLATTQEIPPTTTPETGWVIVGQSTLSTLYLALLHENDCGRPAGDGNSPIAWSWDNQRALRFAREEDARLFLECFKLHGCQVEQHTWG